MLIKWRSETALLSLIARLNSALWPLIGCATKLHWFPSYTHLETWDRIVPLVWCVRLLVHAEGRGRHDLAHRARSVGDDILLRCDGVPIRDPCGLCWPMVTNQHWLDTQDGIVQRRAIILVGAPAVSGHKYRCISTSTKLEGWAQRPTYRLPVSDIQASRRTAGLVIMLTCNFGLMGARSTASRK